MRIARARPRTRAVRRSWRPIGSGRRPPVSTWNLPSFRIWSRAKSGVRAFEKSERRSAACARTMTSSFSKACWHCLVSLRSNLAASVVQGYSFSFVSRPDGDMELNNIVYFRPTIDDPSPLERLDRLFQQYQALSYGVFRTPALQRTLDALQSLTQTLARTSCGPR